MLRLYDFHESGNGFKVRLLLRRLGTPVERIEMNILEGETRTTDFLSRNPNGRIPLLEFEDGWTLAESTAILFFLAQGTAFWPRELTSQRLSAITGKEQELADGPATFEIRMGLRGIRERITSTDAPAHFSNLDRRGHCFHS